MVITEHADSLDSRCVHEVELACKTLSSKQFVVIPGIEIRCTRGIHLLSIGRVGEYKNEGSLFENLIISNKLGNLAVIAHPPKWFLNHYADNAALIHGFEVWNNKENSRWLPSFQAIRQLERIRSFNERCFAYAGLDFHDVYNFSCPWITIDITHLSPENIMDAIKFGKFKIGNGFLSLSSSGKFEALKLYHLPAMYLFKLTSGLLSRFVPSGLKNNIKRAMERI